MRSGVSFPSYAAEPTWRAVSTTYSSGVSNLNDLVNIRRMATINPNGGQITLQCVFPVARPLQMLNVVHHNFPAGSTYLWSIYSDAAFTTNIANVSGSIWPSPAVPNSEYPAVAPMLAGTLLTARSCQLQVFGVGTAQALIGGIEIGGWWEWNNVEVPRAFGVRGSDRSTSLVNASPLTTLQWAARTVAGSRVVTDTEVETTVMDFFREKGRAKPFVWLWDYADGATWARQNILVRNADLPPPSNEVLRGGRMKFSFIEHFR
jgi:hypothetical protein